MPWPGRKYSRRMRELSLCGELNLFIVLSPISTGAPFQFEVNTTDTWSRPTVTARLKTCFKTELQILVAVFSVLKEMTNMDSYQAIEKAVHTPDEESGLLPTTTQQNTVSLFF